eukprot:3469911-Pleurochrysis_carterae.AAC.1
MTWVLRKKRDEKGEILKYKARSVVCGNQEKRTALASGSEQTLQMFAPAARSATFKLLCAGDDGKVHVRPPPDERHFDDRGIPVVLKLLKPLYGEADPGRICTVPPRSSSSRSRVSHSPSSICTTSSKKYDDDHRVDPDAASHCCYFDARTTSAASTG